MSSAYFSPTYIPGIEYLHLFMMRKAATKKTRKKLPLASSPLGEQFSGLDRKQMAAV